jgi:hypothetical protein
MMIARNLGLLIMALLAAEVDGLRSSARVFIAKRL